jgi:hypothetical protein
MPMVVTDQDFQSKVLDYQGVSFVDFCSDLRNRETMIGLSKTNE